MVVNERPMKRMKRRLFADLYDFHTFPTTTTNAEEEEEEEQPFRIKMRAFLEKHAHLTLSHSAAVLPSLFTWQVLLRVDTTHTNSMVSLYVVEEDVTRISSSSSSRNRRSVYCDHCCVAGWSGHPVCRKRYHLIIRAESGSGSLDDGCQDHNKSCSSCGAQLHLSESRCRSCNCMITADDLEDWAYNQFEDHTHLLHAVVHSNGYAHLLTVNGREGGSLFLSGRHIMDFWDRLSTSLALRKVSVMDVSKKYGMEYRLLHSITKGHSWYGEWGYKFGAGSYALTQEAYQKAVDTISSMPLSPFLFPGRGPRTRVQAVIAFYQSLSDTEFETIKDLFSFLLSMIHKACKPLVPTASKMPELSTSNILCAWTRNDVECVQQAMMKVLLAAAGEASWVTRRALKGAMCKTASRELLDYSLKHLGGKVAANGLVVRSWYNPISSAVEFRLEPLSIVHGRFDLNSNYPSEEQIVCDLKLLYDSLLHPETMVNFRPPEMREHLIDSATKLLDCKQFMKDYEPDRIALTKPLSIQLWCYVEFSDKPKDDIAVPPELVVLPLNATVADLKSEATKTFQEVYAMFKRFRVEELPEFGSLDNSITMKFLVGYGASIRVQGRCPAKHGLNRFRMERGMESWTVDCTCGAKDDDGERMLACDTCGVWQHSRCAGIESFEEIPKKFICMRCFKLYSKESEKDSDSNLETKDALLPSTSCRDKAVETTGPGVASNTTLTFGVR
ncbi:PHD finger protein At1g33420 [Quercus suber]|uniref:PHD finger protein At1g33420 n=1 Tax=Quercus suber TaxID=58331 RepID=UPI0032DEF01B